MAFYKVICVATLLTLLTQESHSQLSVCGKPTLNTKIVGGQVATPGSWPWQASLRTSGSHFCAGTLINNQWVMTAAQCCARSGVSTSTLTVYLGLQSLKGSNPNQVSRTVSQIIVHPNFNSRTFDNDICLLKLSSPVTFTTYIQPVCLAATGSTFYKGTVSWATGWGNVGTGVSLPFPQNLMEVQLPIVGNRECTCNYGVSLITNNKMCTGFSAGGKDICQGDGGGPLVSKQGGRWIQAGIVSFSSSKGCAQPKIPSGYTRVSQYQSWINSRITSNQPGFITFTSAGTDGDLSISCPTTPPTAAQVCGQPKLNTRIVGGQVASAGSWPWQASLQTSTGFHFCGGTLINNDWVMTAAQCCSSSGVSTSTLVVSLGLQSLQGSNPNQVSRTVSQIIIHPNFNSGTFENDICLLKLSSPVTFTTYIQPVCLAATGSTFYKGTVSWATGWGNVGSGVSLPFPQNLMEVQLPIVGNRECTCTYGVSLITNNKMCTGFSAGGKDVCQGDGGGPLVSKQGGRWIQAGIVSFTSSKGCAQPNIPSGYTRVSQYQSWINSQITSNQPGFITFTSSGTDGDLSISCPGLPPSIPQVCGQPTLNTKIVGGQVASAGSWPWQASLQTSTGFHFCGGTLINNQWVMTAAHCFASTGVTTSTLTVSLGLQSLQGSNPNKVTRTVSQIIMHPSYNSNTNDNDICLLKLSSPVAFTSYIQPVCLAAPGSTYYKGTLSWATGWGNVGTGVSLPSPGNLMEVQLPIVGNRQCSCTYGLSIITSNKMCAGFSAGGMDTCQGDSGGPLVSKQGGRWIQGGIVSFTSSLGCALPNFQSGYTRVSQYQSWINSQITSFQPGYYTYKSTGTDGDLSVTCTPPKNTP
ncbi:transmembrane protease serine 9-like isoform X2 [Micropterus salmoides]|uniref:transmembrane protease serine 9-like isoform X2 n=1 Tax=Micropterus salmoides TaxID=27706 RepID=UPI0018EC13E4|nr:transmembrane protease serine 9-like isoform X2 [Micropterus salmoides]